MIRYEFSIVTQVFIYYRQKHLFEWINSLFVLSEHIWEGPAFMAWIPYLYFCCAAWVLPSILGNVFLFHLFSPTDDHKSRFIFVAVHSEPIKQWKGQLCRPDAIKLLRECAKHYFEQANIPNFQAYNNCSAAINLVRRSRYFWLSKKAELAKPFLGARAVNREVVPLCRLESWKKKAGGTFHAKDIRLYAKTDLLSGYLGYGDDHPAFTVYTRDHLQKWSCISHLRRISIKLTLNCINTDWCGVKMGLSVFWRGGGALPFWIFLLLIKVLLAVGSCKENGWYLFGPDKKKSCGNDHLVAAVQSPSIILQYNS